MQSFVQVSCEPPESLLNREHLDGFHGDSGKARILFLLLVDRRHSVYVGLSWWLLNPLRLIANHFTNTTYAVTISVLISMTIHQTVVKTQTHKKKKEVNLVALMEKTVGLRKSV